MPKAHSATRKFNPLVAVLVYDGLCTFEFACAAEVFGLPRPELGADWYRFETCGLKQAPSAANTASRWLLARDSNA
jgi:AraC family transcriptional activator FtrA